MSFLVLLGLNKEDKDRIRYDIDRDDVRRTLTKWHDGFLVCAGLCACLGVPTELPNYLLACVLWAGCV